MKAEYFSNIKLEGPPFLSRTDDTVDFDSVPSGISRELSQHYSVRWTGVLVPPETGDYLVGFMGRDGYRVWLDGDLVAEDWTTHRPASTRTKKIHLQKDHAYAAKVEYFHAPSAAEAHLVWSMPGWQRPDALDAARTAYVFSMALLLSALIENAKLDVHAAGLAAG